MLDAAPDPGLCMCESVSMRAVVTDRAEGSCQREKVLTMHTSKMAFSVHVYAVDL